MTNIYRKVVETPEQIDEVSKKINELIMRDDGRVLIECDTYFTKSQQMYWAVLKNYFAVAVLRRVATNKESDQLGEILKLKAGLTIEFECQGVDYCYPLSLTTVRSKKAMRLFLDRVISLLYDTYSIEVPSRDDYLTLVAELGASGASKMLEQQFIRKLSTIKPVKLLAS